MFGVVRDRLYVAGGIGTSNSLALVGSVEAYDMDRDAWEQVTTSSRAELMTLPGYQTVLSGCLVAKNIGWGQRLGIAFNPLTNTLRELPPAMVQGWQGPTTSVQGHMFIVDFGDDYKLKTWDAHTQAWAWVGQVRLPAVSHKPWAAQLVCFLDYICLVLPDRSLVMAPLPPLLRSLERQRRRREREGRARGRGSGRWRHEEERCGRSDGEEDEEDEEGGEDEVVLVKVIPGPGAGEKGSELVLTNAVLGCQVLAT
ncbi:hypothetical protein CLOP_g3997 [Closterium sp. NIES-67]|nr:hypothetical protein CLOP_g3997 [Closterium sp. NIES-67]